MLKIRDLHVNIKDKEILKDISLDISRGSWTCIIGPNAAGKSTLLKTILGTHPYTGSIQSDGEEVFGNNRRSIGYIAQNPTIPIGMSIREFVSLGAGWRKGTAKEISNDRIDQVLIDSNLFGRAKSLISELSGGELQRALVARTVLSSPELLLLDEPTSALDLHHQISVMNIFESYKSRGSTIISTLHDLSLASLYADQLVVMSAGRVIEHGPTQSVIHGEALKKAYGKQISVHTLETGRTVIVANPEN